MCIIFKAAFSAMTKFFFVPIEPLRINVAALWYTCWKKEKYISCLVVDYVSRNRQSFYEVQFQ